jgi:hypothetical protein
MAKHELNHGDRALLILLMTIGAEVTNTDLKTIHAVALDRERRDKLEGLRLIKVNRPGGRIAMELTATGGEVVTALLTAPPAPGGGLQVAATNALLAHAARYVERNGGTPADFFAAAVVDLDADAIEDRIRKAYTKLAHRPGEWVTLTALRELLGGIPRDQVDAVLVRLNRTPSVTIVPEQNQKSLTEADRAAAVIIGNQPKHAIAIGHR